MEELALLRQIYGNDTYVTPLPDGRMVPWKPLSVQEFLEYENIKDTGPYIVSQLEDEIFRKCVVDPVLVDNIRDLKAGIVETVVASIMAHSGPQSIEELNQHFQLSRLAIQNIVHQLVLLVCQAFPGYKPEEVYEMQYPILIQRAALAEDKLLKAGILQEKLSFEPSVPQQQQQPSKSKVDSKQLFDRFQQQQKPAPPPPSTKTTIISTQDMVEQEAAYTGHERADKIIREAKMVDETSGIYADYMKQIKDGKKVVIPSTEERVRAAKARAKANEERYKASLKVKGKQDADEMAKLLEVREKERARKARKRRR